MTSDFRLEVEIRLFRACTMHPAVIIGTVRPLWTWLCGRYHVPQNVFLVTSKFVSLIQITVYFCFLSSICGVLELQQYFSSTLLY